MFQTFEHSQEFLLVYVIIPLRWDEGGGIVGDGVLGRFFGSWVYFSLL